MKISAISTFRPQSINYINNNRNNNVAFGFGPEISDDDYLGPNDYEHREGSGSVLEYLKLLGELAYSLISENVPDRCCCSRSRVIDDDDDIIPDCTAEACENVSVEDDQDNVIDEDVDIDDDSEQVPVPESEEEQFEKIMDLFRDEDFDVMCG